MQLVHNWSSAYPFKVGKGKDAKPLITIVLFPQPLIPYVKMATAGQDAVIQVQHQFEAANLVSVKSMMSETDLVGITELDRPLGDTLFGATPFVLSHP